MTDLTLDEEIRQEFLAESKEGIERLDRDLVALEGAPDNQELLASVFRVVHTIKGTSGFLGFSRLEGVAHAAETLLSNLRDGAVRMNEPIATALLAMLDVLRGLITNVEHLGTDGDENQSALVARLEALASSKASEPTPPAAAHGSEAPMEEAGARELALGAVEPERAAPPAVGETTAVTHTRIQTQSVRAAPSPDSASEEGLRVDVGLIDSLINLAGELVLVRNEVLQTPAATDDPSFLALSRRLDVITVEMQDRIMRMRMQPLRTLFARLPRVVRELARTCGKSVRIEIDGHATELDRTLMEAIKDPLLHLLRNAVDHGIESPEDRRAKGKPAEGTISLRAYHAGGVVNIEIGDDGVGISAEKIRRKAIQRGLLKPTDTASMLDQDVLDLIFLPGFSTAEKVTNVSGRGVGMDVVKTNVEKIGGFVELTSREGVGTTFRLKIPLTLAIVPGVIVHCRNQRFAIPQVSLLEFVRVEDPSTVERVHDAVVYRLRGRLLPLVFLDRALGLQGDPGPGQGAGFHVAVLSSAGRAPFGLVVDRLGDTQEIVVKALAPILQVIRMFSGATILGDGSVALILDVEGIAHAAEVGASASAVRADAEIKDETIEELPALGDREQEFLLVQLAGGGRASIPLTWIDRIENLPRQSVERAGDHDVIQIRDEIVPVVDLAETLPERRSRPRAAPPADLDPNLLSLIIARSRTVPVAIIVERVVDVVAVSPFLKRTGCRAGVEGTTVIDGRVTEVLSMPQVLQLAGITESPTPRSLRAAG